jgi:hypothetical protein
VYAVATFLIVALVSLLATRMATGFLVATGMPPQTAAFQARSAFTGAGFTTAESENVVNHPVRRRVISVTMFVGNLGIPTLIVTVVVGLVGPSTSELTTRLFVLVAGIAVVVLLAFLRPVTRLFVELGRRTAGPVMREAFHGDVEALLSLGTQTEVVAVTLSGDIPLRSLRGLQNALPQIQVLGVRPGGDAADFLTGSPTDVDLTAGDQVVVMGRREVLRTLLPSLQQGSQDPGIAPTA